jgi:hypothetical protein
MDPLIIFPLYRFQPDGIFGDHDGFFNACLCCDGSFPIVSTLYVPVTNNYILINILFSK